MQLKISGGYFTQKDGTHVIYEPIGNYEYLCYYEGQKEIFKAQTLQPAKDDKGADPEHFISIFGETHTFPDYPFHEENETLSKLLHIPDRETINLWLKGEFKLPKKSELYTYLRNYFKLFGDYQETYHPAIMALQVLETYYLPLLNTVFFVNLQGAPGSGKTTILQAMCEVSYRGLPADSLSPAFRTRFISRYGSPLYQDEIDATEKDDGLGQALARTSYRRGMFYGRWNQETNQPELVEHFAPQTATYHIVPEDSAYLTRSLTNIEISQSKDHTLAIVNSGRESISRKLAAFLYFSRFEILDRALHDGLSPRDSEFDILDLGTEAFEPEKKRNTIYDHLTRLLDKKQKKLLEKIFGRSSELAYVAVLIAKLLNIDVISDLIDAINTKISEDSVPTDERFLQLIEELNDRGSSPEAFKLRNVTMNLESWCKERKIDPAKTNTINAWLEELGFRKSKEKFRKGGDIMILITPGIAKRLKVMGESAGQIDKKEFEGLFAEQDNQDNRTINPLVETDPKK